MNNRGNTSTTICFRATDTLRQEIEMLAVEDRRSLSSFIVLALEREVERQKGATKPKGEKP